MSGPPINKRGRGIFGVRKAPAPRDKCDIEVTVDLIGVRRDVAVKVKEGDVLGVGLTSTGENSSAVCSTADGEIVGALAAFPGIAQLIQCIAEGVAYRALVEVAGPTRCQVTVSGAGR